MKLLKPDYYVDSVYDFDFSALYKKGYRVIFADLDNTLAPWDSNTVTEELKQWVADILANNMELILVSNAKVERVEKFSKELNVKGIALARKPLGFGFKKALKKLSKSKNEVLMVGDQVFTDVLGARLQNITVALVKPLSEKELKITKLMRRLEKPLRDSILNKHGQDIKYDV